MSADCAVEGPWYVNYTFYKLLLQKGFVTFTGSNYGETLRNFPKNEFIE
tara:strand:- start:938 stop:1084 length:147 start_codon:yes stop_codon:yes gene_type:complete